MAAQLPPKGAENVLYLVDLSGYVFRAYHAIAPLSNSKGEPTHAVMGTVNMLQKVVNGRQPHMFAVAMDSRTRSFRKDLDPRYKANRPAPPDDLKSQMVRCEEVVRAYNIPVYQQDGMEADDVIASVVKRAMQTPSCRVVIVSADKDLMQLVRDDDERVLLWDSMRDKTFGPAEVKEKFGVPPSRLRDLLALTGDTSDNVPGVPGVGPKTAAELLTQFASLDEIYAKVAEVKRVKLRENLVAHEADARMSAVLVTLKNDLEVAWEEDTLRYGGFHEAELRALLTELEFTRLLETLSPKGGGTNTPFGGEKAASTTPKSATATKPASAPLPKSRARIHDAEALSALLSTVTKGDLTVLGVTSPGDAAARSLLGLGIATPSEVAYVPTAHRYLGAPAQLSSDVALARVFEHVQKHALRVVTHDARNLAIFCERQGLSWPAEVFDVRIASYLLDPDGDHALPSIAEREGYPNVPTLDGSMAAEAPKAAKAKGAKGAKGTPFEEWDVESAASRVWEQTAALFGVAPSLVSRIESEQLGPLAKDIEFPMTRALAAVEVAGVYVDVERLAVVSKRLEGRIRELETEAVKLAGHDFSLRSRDQLETILFDELKLPSIKRTPKGGRSTDAEVLEELATMHALPGVVCDYRELDKLKGTYLDALPRYVNPKTGRIHTYFEQALAATGRLSSVEPNLQNIPVRGDLGKEIRGAFVAPEGRAILSADYSQIELRVLAHLSQDKELIRAFEGSEDVHTHTASLVFEVDKANVTAEMRRRAKTINFGVIYGMGESALSKQLRIPREEAARFIASYFRRYEGVRNFMDKTVESARKGEAVRTLFGRRRFLPNLHSSNRGLRFEAERIAKNTPIQGTAADILKRAMVSLWRQPPSKGAKMVLTVHDELVFEVPEAEIETAKVNVVRQMRAAAELSVPLVVDAGAGASWAEAH
ncbi:MAG: DNA polymerase I [Polyangiaceae bacterium]